MPPHFTPRPNPFHPIKFYNNDHDDEDDAYIDMPRRTNTHPRTKNVLPRNPAPPNSPASPTGNRSPNILDTITPPLENTSTFVSASTSPLDNKASHYNNDPVRNQGIRTLHSPLVPLTTDCIFHQIDRQHSLVPTTKPDTRDDSTTLEFLRFLYTIAITLDVITILTYLFARHRAISAGSVMEEAVARVEFETRMRDVLMAGVGGVLWVAVAGQGAGGVRQPTTQVVRRVGRYVGVVCLVYVVAVRGVDGVLDWVMGWL